MSRKRNTLIFILLIILTVTLISGCGSTKDKISSNTNNISNLKLTLYFPNQDASWLIPIERSTSVPDKEVIKTIFKELDSPPPGFPKPLPKGTILLGASVKDGIATLDLSKEFQSNFSGGSSAEQMILFSIVNSLATLSNVQAVQFLLEGQVQEAIFGHLDTSIPIKRNESMIKK